ncbi:MAG: L-rhamnose isomerase [Spirochaetaceae bacterium]|jgi:L-rhamnose isomerase|nr:L-rhamnose isomerase [Spirochaetaceae bacterium]
MKEKETEEIKRNGKRERVERAYELAREAYRDFGVATEEAIRAALEIPVSIQCWQGDDVTGFEEAEASGPGRGGILATGSYPGRARNGDELRKDAEFAFSLIPGAKRFNLHSFYAETKGRTVRRDELEPEHFEIWMAWSRKNRIPLDFNPSFFSHPLAESGYTLSHRDPEIRRFWIRHAIAARRVAAAFGANQDGPAMNNLWIPDGSKDAPADRLGPRRRLRDALDEVYAVPLAGLTDALESKLFGIGSESYVVGSHEFYLGYAGAKQLYLCLDTGHFHPTETIADKISAALLFVPGLLLHFSRGVRWDSDHVAIHSDDQRDICREIVRQKAFGQVRLALDFFDASINRVAAWTIGARSLRKSLLEAFLEPTRLLLEAENAGRYHERLGLMEISKTLPLSAVWDKLCLDAAAPVGSDWIAQVNTYEETELLKR